MIHDENKIHDKDKQEAWFALWERIARGLVDWPRNLSQVQVDYLMSQIERNASPGTRGRVLRAAFRWNCLDFAFEILRARDPGISARKTYEAVAKHYGCSWSTVRKARARMSEQDFSIARRHRELGFTDQDFAELSLPHIVFDAFADE